MGGGEYRSGEEEGEREGETDRQTVVVEGPYRE
jgi:hypothetical protein